MSATFQITPEMRKAKQRENAAKYTLYWPGDQWYFGEYGGNPYWIPPDLGGKKVQHPVFRENGVPTMCVADGVLVVRDAYGVIYGAKAVPSEGVWKRPILDRDGPLPDHTAEKIITHFTRGDHARLGVVELTGDPEMDVMVKAEARKRYLDTNKEWALSERNARMEVLAKFKKENPGLTEAHAPGPTPSQNRAEIVLLRLTTADSSKAAYKCECGMFEHDDKDLFEMHQQARHGKVVVAPELKATEAEPTEEEVAKANIAAELVNSNTELLTQGVKRGPGRPRKTEG